LFETETQFSIGQFSSDVQTATLFPEIERFCDHPHFIGYKLRFMTGEKTVIKARVSVRNAAVRFRIAHQRGRRKMRCELMSGGYRLIRRQKINNK
jgi:hypothetical protein